MARTTKGRLFKRGENWHAQYYVDGKEFKRSMKTTDKKAAGRRMKDLVKSLNTVDKVDALQGIKNQLLRAQLAEAEKNAVALAASWQAFKDSPRRRDASDATMRQYGFQWQAFIDWCANNHTALETLPQLTPEIGDRYAAHLATRGLSTGTYNKHIRLCRMVCKVLQARMDDRPNPFIGIGSKVELQNSRKEFSRDKLQALCDAATGELKSLLFLGIYTGQRLGDCCLLKWDQIDLKAGIVIIEPRKTKRRAISKAIRLPIVPSLRATFEMTPKGERTGYVLPTMADKYLRDITYVTDDLQRFFKANGVQLYVEGTGKGSGKGGKRKRAVLQYGFHSLRHTTVTLLQEQGVAAAVIREIVGHHSTAVTDRYTHIGDDVIAAGMAKLPDLSGRNAIRDDSDPLAAIADLCDSADAKNWQSVLEQIAAIAKS